MKKCYVVCRVHKHGYQEQVCKVFRRKVSCAEFVNKKSVRNLEHNYFFVEVSFVEK